MYTYVYIYILYSNECGKPSIFHPPESFLALQVEESAKQAKEAARQAVQVHRMGMRTGTRRTWWEMTKDLIWGTRRGYTCMRYHIESHYINIHINIYTCTYKYIHMYIYIYTHVQV